jgi:hypothetical protein
MRCLQKQNRLKRIELKGVASGRNRGEPALAIRIQVALTLALFFRGLRRSAIEETALLLCTATAVRDRDGALALQATHPVGAVGFEHESRPLDDVLIEPVGRHVAQIGEESRRGRSGNDEWGEV